jgi:hypothetical protein
MRCVPLTNDKQGLAKLYSLTVLATAAALQLNVRYAHVSLHRNGHGVKVRADHDYYPIMNKG